MDQSLYSSTMKNYFEDSFCKNDNNDNSENKKQNEIFINKGENEEINKLKNLFKLKKIKMMI